MSGGQGKKIEAIELVLIACLRYNGELRSCVSGVLRISNHFDPFIAFFIYHFFFLTKHAL